MAAYSPQVERTGGLRRWQILASFLCLCITATSSPLPGTQHGKPPATASEASTKHLLLTAHINSRQDILKHLNSTDGEKDAPNSSTLAGYLQNAAGRLSALLTDTIGFSDTGPNDNRRHWPPFTVSWRVAIATLLGFLAAALATPGGIGGGPLFVPLFNLVLGYDATTSTALSKGMIFGGSIASLCFNIQLRHPRHEKHLIDFDVAVLMQPLLLLGISIGVTFNVILPDWVIKILLCSLLFFMGSRTLAKGVSTWKQETKKAKEKRGDGDGAVGSADMAEAKKPLLQSASEIMSKVRCRPADQDPAFHLIKWTNVAEVSGVWLVFLVLQVTKNYVHTCGVLYWVLIVAQIPAALFVSYIGAKRMWSEHERRVAGYHELGEYSPEETQWAPSLLATATIYALLAGVIGGLFGVGGAILMGPVLLELGLPPQVTTATTSFMIIFSSSLTVIEYYLLDFLPVNVELYFTVVCFTAALFGLSVVRAFVLWSGKTSIIIFVLGFVIAISAFLILVLGGWKIYTEWISGAYMGLSSVCSTQ